MPDNFSFVIPGKLAGCARPGRWTDLRSDLAGMTRQGIGAVVTLTESPLDRKALEDVGLLSLHIPVEDLAPPRPEQVDAFVEFVGARLAEGVGVVVHCAAGVGRTGTMLACYLVSRGMTAAEAVREVRRARPGSIETREQEKSVGEYHRRLTRLKSSERERRG